MSTRSSTSKARLNLKVTAVLVVSARAHSRCRHSFSSGSTLTSSGVLSSSGVDNVGMVREGGKGILLSRVREMEEDVYQCRSLLPGAWQELQRSHHTNRGSSIPEMLCACSDRYSRSICGHCVRIDYARRLLNFGITITATGMTDMT